MGINIDNIDELLIWQILEEKGYGFMTVEQLMCLDYSIIGLSPKNVYGKYSVLEKVQFKYGDDICVEEVYTYTETGFTTEFIWYDNDKNVGCTKVEDTEQSQFEIDEREENDRKRLITYIKSSNNPLIKAFVGDLLKRYQEELFLFINNGSDELKTAIENEDDPSIVGYLNYIPDPTPIEGYPLGISVRETILENLP